MFPSEAGTWGRALGTCCQPHSRGGWPGGVGTKHPAEQRWRLAGKELEFKSSSGFKWPLNAVGGTLRHLLI